MRIRSSFARVPALPGRVLATWKAASRKSGVEQTEQSAVAGAIRF
jgi:hypothetical protein